MGQNKFFKFTLKANRIFFKRKLLRWFKYFGKANNRLLGLEYFNAWKNSYASFFGHFIFFKKRFFSKISVNFNRGVFPKYSSFLKKTHPYR